MAPRNKIKHDGYRLIVVRDGARVRLFTRNGNDWTKRLEGLVSKRRDRPYRGGRSPDWVKVKNRSHPAIDRIKEAFA